MSDTSDQSDQSVEPRMVVGNVSVQYAQVYSFRSIVHIRGRRILLRPYRRVSDALSLYTLRLVDEGPGPEEPDNDPTGFFTLEELPMKVAGIDVSHKTLTFLDGTTNRHQSGFMSVFVVLRQAEYSEVMYSRQTLRKKCRSPQAVLDPRPPCSAPSPCLH